MATVENDRESDADEVRTLFDNDKSSDDQLEAIEAVATGIALAESLHRVGVEGKAGVSYAQKTFVFGDFPRRVYCNATGIKRGSPSALLPWRVETSC